MAFANSVYRKEKKVAKAQKSEKNQEDITINTSAHKIVEWIFHVKSSDIFTVTNVDKNA